MHNLSNYPNTLLRNRNHISVLENINQYKALVNQVESANQLDISNYGSISFDALRSPVAVDQFQSGEIIFPFKAIDALRQIETTQQSPAL